MNWYWFLHTVNEHFTWQRQDKKTIFHCRKSPRATKRVQDSISAEAQRPEFTSWNSRNAKVIHSRCITWTVRGRRRHYRQTESNCSHPALSSFTDSFPLTESPRGCFIHILGDRGRWINLRLYQIEEVISLSSCLVYKNKEKIITVFFSTSIACDLTHTNSLRQIECE